MSYMLKEDHHVILCFTLRIHTGSINFSSLFKKQLSSFTLLAQIHCILLKDSKYELQRRFNNFMESQYLMNK